MGGGDLKIHGISNIFRILMNNIKYILNSFLNQCHLFLAFIWIYTYPYLSTFYPYIGKYCHGKTLGGLFCNKMVIFVQKFDWKLYFLPQLHQKDDSGSSTMYIFSDSWTHLSQSIYMWLGRKIWRFFCDTPISPSNSLTV